MIQSWNNAAEQIFGYSKQDAIGKPINILAFSGQEDEIDNIINIIREGEIYSYETIRQKKDGETVAVLLPWPRLPIFQAILSAPPP